MTTDERQAILIGETVKRIMQDFRIRRMQNMVGHPESITNESLVPEELSRHAEAAEIVKAVLAVLPAAQADRWQDISTAPKDGTEVLGYRPPSRSRRTIYICAWRKIDSAGSAWVSVIDRMVAIPTHWRPLPAPPVIAEQREVKS
jgi:hypothetical protein